MAPAEKSGIEHTHAFLDALYQEVLNRPGQVLIQYHRTKVLGKDARNHVGNGLAAKHIREAKVVKASEMTLRHHAVLLTQLLKYKETEYGTHSGVRKLTKRWQEYTPATSTTTTENGATKKRGFLWRTRKSSTTKTTIRTTDAKTVDKTSSTIHDIYSRVNRKKKDIVVEIAMRMAGSMALYWRNPAGFSGTLLQQVNEGMLAATHGQPAGKRVGKGHVDDELRELVRDNFLSPLDLLVELMQQHRNMLVTAQVAKELVVSGAAAAMTEKRETREQLQADEDRLAKLEHRPARNILTTPRNKQADMMKAIEEDKAKRVAAAQHDENDLAHIENRKRRELAKEPAEKQLELVEEIAAAKERHIKEAQLWENHFAGEKKEPPRNIEKEPASKQLVLVAGIVATRDRRIKAAQTWENTKAFKDHQSARSIKKQPDVDKQFSMLVEIEKEKGAGKRTAQGPAPGHDTHPHGGAGHGAEEHKQMVRPGAAHKVQRTSVEHDLGQKGRKMSAEKALKARDETVAEKTKANNLKALEALKAPPKAAVKKTPGVNGLAPPKATVNRRTGSNMA